MKTLYYKYVCCCYYLISSLIFIKQNKGKKKLKLMEAFSYRAFDLYSRQKSFQTYSTGALTIGKLFI